MMKTRNILTLIVAAIIFSSCSMSLQQRRVADELYQTPDSQQDQEQVFAAYYDEAEKMLKDESQEEVDSVIYEDKVKSSGNPYQDILVDDYDQAYQRRIDASKSLSYGMSDWYGTYYSNDFWYASAYDPSFYNVIVMGDDVWVEPNWLTSHFGTGWKYGSFYNYPYYGQSFMNPYRSTLSMSGIYGFNSMGYGAYSYNAFGRSPFGYSSFGYGYSPYRYSPFGYSSFGYSPFGYSSFGYGSYYGFSPYYSGYNSYYNTLQQQKLLQEEYKLNDEGRVAKFSNHSQRIRRSDDANTDGTTKSYIRVQEPQKSGNARSVHSVRTRRTSEQSATSKYVKTRNENVSTSRPRYNRPKNEASYEQVREERVRRQSINSSSRKRSSTYRPNGNTRSSTRSSISSGNSSSGSNSSGSTRSSSGSSSSGRKRK